MTKYRTKLRAKLVGETVRGMVLINHPMESGMPKPGAYEKPPPCYHITEIIVWHKGQPVFIAHWNGTIARNPYLGFQFRGAKRGDTVVLKWIDNDGGMDTVETRVS